MPVTLILEGHILHYVFQDPVNMLEISDVEKIANTYYENADRVLHSLMDLRKLHRLPNGIFKFRATKGLTHPMAGQTAIVMDSLHIQKIAETFIRLSGNNRIHFFSSDKVQDAWDYLHGLLEQDAARVPAQPGDTGK